MKWPTPLPAWLDAAFRFRGLKEIPGKQNNPKITNMLIKLKAWWRDDETPWCGTFVAYCLDLGGQPVPQHWYRAKAYADYGTQVPRNAREIPFGSIAVKSRVGGGHVFFPVARSADGLIIYGLGGNQRNMVNITPFRLSEIDAIRWPPSSAFQHLLPVVTALEIGAESGGGSES